jgi:hypothetical protein
MRVAFDSFIPGPRACIRMSISRRTSRLKLPAIIGGVIFCAGVAQSFAAIDALRDNKTRSSSQFCGPKLVRSFGLPPGGRQQYKPIPENGLLSFGPQKLRVSQKGPRPGGALQSDPSAGNRVLTAGGKFGYLFSSLPWSGGSRLNWTIRLTASTVTKQGQFRNRLGETAMHIGSIQGHTTRSVVLSIPPKKGFYRLALSIRSSKGQLLDAFAEFIRVIEPSAIARLGTSSRTVVPGEQVLGRIENFGSTMLRTRQPYSVEYFDGVEWERVGPPQTVWRGPGMDAIVYAGKAAACMSFRVPADAAPGRYRFVKNIRVGQFGRLSERTLYGDFNVSPTA